jgi:Bacteriophage baseplate protein W
MNLQYPYGFSNSGLTAQTVLASHIRDLIEQILLTSPGERVNRPTLGTGTGALVFAPNSDMLAAAQQQVIQASLQQWLSDLIRVASVDVSNEDATLQITVSYVILQTQEQQTQQIVYGGGSA